MVESCVGESTTNKANKVQRVTSAMRILNQSQGTSAREIAKQLGVCERSAYRYLRELKALGTRFTFKSVKVHASMFTRNLSSDLTN